MGRIEGWLEAQSDWCNGRGWDRTCRRAPGWADCAPVKVTMGGVEGKILKLRSELVSRWIGLWRIAQIAGVLQKIAQMINVARAGEVKRKNKHGTSESIGIGDRS